MRGQRALGFPSPVFLVVVVVVVILRRKWRQSVARSEEVRRLLVSASEESTRAELAREAYYYTATAAPSVRVSSPTYDSVQLGSPSKPQYQCAVCFRPTTTRCAKCKAVRYCSGKCQIFHWRQGHKDECRPYVSVTQINNVGDHKDHSDSFDTETKQTATSAESKSPLSHEDHSVSSTPTSFSADVTFENNLETVKSADETPANPARKSTGLLDNNLKTSSDEDTHSGTSSSSFWTDDGSNESSSPSEPSTNPGFWDGNVPNKKSSINKHDDVAPGSVGETKHGQLTNHTTEVISNIKMNNGSLAAKVIDGERDDVAPGSVGDTKHCQLINHTAEVISNSNMNNGSRAAKVIDGVHDDVAPGSVGEAEHGQLTNHTTEVTSNSNTNNGFNAAKVIDGFDLGSKKPNDITDLPTVSRYPGVSEKSNDIIYNKNTPPYMSKSRDEVSSSPRPLDTKLIVTSRNTSHSTKPVTVVDDVSHKITTSSSQLTEASRRGSKTSKLKIVDHLKPSKSSHHESLEGASVKAHNCSFKGLFPYEMFIKLYNCKQIELQPSGLKNCGNSCYANAVLQCLIYTPPLTAYLLEGLHYKACEKRGWCFTCELEGLVRKAKDGISPLSPIRILTHIENIGSNLGHGKEEDAHEFLRYVIDALQSVCIKESRKKSLNSLEEETTLIGLTFGGYLRSKIMCMKCGVKSEQHERMMDLTVEIEGGIRTLEDALNKFTCTEVLDGENKYKCNRCKSYEKAKKKFTILEAPNVLTIALKRFQSGKYGKLNKSITFPEILDMAPYVSGTSDKSPIYSLYGVVVHVDTMNAAFSGHYVCYVKNLQNRWFKFDDSVVKEVDLKHVLTKEAYMLLYARCSPRAPRSIRSSIIHHHHHDSRKHKIASSIFSKSHSTAPWDACSYHPSRVNHRSLEEESASSDNSSFFSESCSCSTESTRSIEDHINLNSSDSDTSSSSSFSSPLYSRLARLYSPTANREEDNKTSKVCRNLDCSCSSCRITNLDRLGQRVTYPTSKPSVTVRRSTSRGKKD